MIEPSDFLSILTPESDASPSLLGKLSEVGIENPARLIDRLRSIPDSEKQRQSFAAILPGLLFAFSQTPDVERSLVNFQRFAWAVKSRDELFAFLSREPRAIEILMKLFVGSQFLTEILLRQPDSLQRLTEYKRVAEFKSREEYFDQVRGATEQCQSIEKLMLKFRSYQQWEILRIAACDTFGLMDLRTVTRQLSFLAEAVVANALSYLEKKERLKHDQLAVIAFGKLGGCELNYSSDIDLVFVSEQHPESFWPLAQKMIKVLSEFTDLGFLYRVDMRLRPWGNSGPLVTSGKAYREYLEQYGQLWEHQSLLKARTIAGNFELGDSLLESLRSSNLDFDKGLVRQKILMGKQKIEKKISLKGHKYEDIKNGPGGIRDIEFLVQYLQFVHQSDFPQVCVQETIEGLIRLSEADLIHAQEYRTLSIAYRMLRTIEHALQIMHNQPERFLPESQRELAYLARRLDFPNAGMFLEQLRKHTRAVAVIFKRHLADGDGNRAQTVHLEADENQADEDRLIDVESIAQRKVIDRLLCQLSDAVRIAVEVLDSPRGGEQLVLVGSDLEDSLPIISGMLFGYGFDIVSADILPIDQFMSMPANSTSPNLFVAHLDVCSTIDRDDGEHQNLWQTFIAELNQLVRETRTGHSVDAHGKLIRSLSRSLGPQYHSQAEPLLPVEIQFDSDGDGEVTRLSVRGEDVSGFLYELTSAVVLSGLQIKRMQVRTQGRQVLDHFYVIDPTGADLRNEHRQTQFRAAIVLIKHFTHLLPQAPNPEAALVHFRELLENLFRQSDWLDQFKTLENPKVLSAIAQLLGVSDFLWEDFLRIQHENLFPVVTDISGLEVSCDRSDLERELSLSLSSADAHEQVDALNRFKDRAMMRADMRHILGLQEQFGMFSLELTAVAETVVTAALKLCEQALQPIHGVPVNGDGQPVKLSVCALGKCGGKELGYASDIELMFVYSQDGQTTGPESISAQDYFQRVVQHFQKVIHTRQRRIFEMDLRLRPYGNAGSLAVSLESFANYFRPQGPAWPYERQGLVKLRPIAGDEDFGKQVTALRDGSIYRGEPFDISAMRAMREKQIRQLVEPGTFHAKLSPGGLVDCEYFVQGLQITYGHLGGEVRDPNTREAMKALEHLGILTSRERIQLRDAYRFLRRLIDAMRMVRGDASDLTIPPLGTDQFEFLARRLNMPNLELHQEIEQHTCVVIGMISSFEEFIARR